MDFTDITRIGEAINDKVDDNWINEINSLNSSGDREATLDVKLVGVTFEFNEEDRQENIRVISDMDSIDFAIRKVGSTGLDIVAYSDESYIGSVGWIPKEVARPLSKILDNVEIRVEKYQVSETEINQVCNDIADFFISDMDDDEFDDFIEENTKLAFNIKIRFVIKSLFDNSNLLIGEKNE